MLRAAMGWGGVALLLTIAASPASAQPQPPPDPAPRFDARGRQSPSEDEAPAAPQNIVPPKLLEHAEAAYPQAARDQGIEGDVILKLTIDETGKVVASEVLEGAGHGFDEAALTASKNLRFEPARFEDGTPFKAIIKYRYRFELEDAAEPEPTGPVPGKLSGRVLVRGPDQPLAGARLTITPEGGEPVEVTAGPNGEFSLPDLEPASYRVRIEAPGYEPLEVTESVGDGEVLTATYRLTPQTTGEVIDVFVAGEKPPREVTKRTIEQREINRLPGTRGDALRSIESLPGVARPPGIAGILLVRGSSPFDTQTFIDGVYVPIIYHFGGLSSVVPTELLSKIDFYPGNFSARYGRAQGGIVDAGIRSPRGDGYHGLAQLDLIDARLLFEGPIPLLEGWTFAVAGRRSYLDAWLGPTLEEAGAEVGTAPVYYDYQLIIEKKWKQDARFRTSFYGSDDRLALLIKQPAAGEPALTGNLGFSTSFQRLQLGYEQRFTPNDSLEVQLALGRDALSFGLGGLFFDLESLAIIGRAEYTRRLAKGASMHLGLDMFGGTARVAARLPAPPRPGEPAGQPFSTRNTLTIDQRNAFYRPAGYLEFELTPHKRWRIVPGFRLDYAQDTGKVDAAPRINTRVDVIEGFPRTTLKGGVGVFNQPPQFGESVEPIGTAGIQSNRAIHYSLGVEQEITRQLEASVEGFYKQLDNQVVAAASASGEFVEYVNTQSGYAGGMEVLIKYKPDDRFFGWIAYTLSRSVRRNAPGEEAYQVFFDQPHILTMLGSYRIGGGWEIGARFRLISGNLVDPNVCNFADETCDPSRINALFHAPTGAYTPIRFGGVNSERLPPFHSLDLRVDKAWQFKLWKLGLYIDVQNAYNNRNVEAINYDVRYSTRQYVTGIPILPSFGIRGEF